MIKRNRTFVVLIALVTLAFGWVLWPLFGAVFWAVAFVIVLDPIASSLSQHLGQRRNLAALIMITGFLLLIILPTLLILTAVVREASSLIAAVESGEINLYQMFQSVLDSLPAWSKAALQRLGLGNLTAAQRSIADSSTSWFGTNTPTILYFGQNTLGLFVGLGVMLYLMFFLFRDGDAILDRIKSAIPMETDLVEDLFHTLGVVVRATVHRDILVSLLQGCLGGLGFWLLGVHGVILWTVLMSLLSLVPVFGAALVWGPVAIYFLANGLIWKGIVLMVYGVMVIGLIDNIARPWLVGQATRMPHYVVLISTIGGIATFGIQGFIMGPVIAAMFIAVWTTFLAKTKA